MCKNVELTSLLWFASFYFAADRFHTWLKTRFDTRESDTKVCLEITFGKNLFDVSID